MKTRTIETGRFTTINPKGQYVTVIEETEQTGFDALGSTSTTWRDGVRSYRTSENGAVNWVNDNEFQLVATSEALKRA